MNYANKNLSWFTIIIDVPYFLTSLSPQFFSPGVARQDSKHDHRYLLKEGVQ
jgi:hypothetical protein